MDINRVTFPIYKLRSYIKIERTPLDLVKVTTIKGVYILDDTSLHGNLEERRAQLYLKFPKKEIYKLKEQVNYLRQLVKYKSGTTFIDLNGTLMKYKKSSRLYDVVSHKIINIKKVGDRGLVLKLENIDQSFYVINVKLDKITHVSVIYTIWGPFLYDITSAKHKPYKRKI